MSVCVAYLELGVAPSLLLLLLLVLYSLPNIGQSAGVS